MLRYLLSVLALLVALVQPVVAEEGPLFTREDLGPVADFSFTDQRGQAVTRQHLLGKVWVAFFFYVGCTEGCADTTRNIAALTQQFTGWSDVHFVGFSVRSSNDDVAALAQYAAAFDADQNGWSLLTGPEQEVHELVRNSFRQAVMPTPERGQGKEVVHTFRFVLVDHRGQIRGYINDGRDGNQVAALVRQLQLQMQAKYLPTANAGLNLLCALLLVAGYLAIQRRCLTCHKVCMLSALAVSALFLACYLYYHFVVLDGSPTRFSGTGPIRLVYFAVLLSHTILAALVAPMALVSAGLGLRHRLKGHVWLARWTLPLWLYVSITGVVVYWMLYHLYAPI